jgi:cytoskeletal protein CcmA (bactofilin family)
MLGKGSKPMRLVATRRRWTLLLLLMLAVIGVACNVEASDGMRGDKCVVAEDEYIVEDFYFLCRILDIRGTIDGDVIGAASQITIYQTAVITGDLWVGGGKLLVEGRIGDDMHFFGMTVTVANHTRFENSRIDLLSVAINTEIMRDAVLPGDLLVYGYQVKVDGTIGGDIDFSGEALLINGVVAGRVDAEVGDTRRNTDLPGLPIYDLSFEDPGLAVGENAHIGSDLVYRSRTAVTVPPGVVQGELVFEQLGRRPDITKVAQPRDAAEILVDYFRAALNDVITLLVLGLISLGVVPNLIRHSSQHVRRRTVPTIGWGLITFMLSIPTVIVVVVLGLILLLILYLVRLNELTILMGVGLLIASSGLIGGFSFLLLYMGRVVVCFALGQLVDRYVLRSLPWSGYRRWAVTTGIGTVIYALIVDVPVPAMGLIIEMISSLAGVGAVVMHIRSTIDTTALLALRDKARARSTPPVISVTLLSPEDLEPTPGMANLPEGFTGFDEDS